MSAPLCNTCGEALSTLSHPPSGQERDCPERETKMAETRETSFGRMLTLAWGGDPEAVELLTFESKGRDHTHDRWEHAVCLSGPCEIIVDGEKQPAPVGTVFSVPPDTPHRMRPTTDEASHWLLWYSYGPATLSTPREPEVDEEALFRVVDILHEHPPTIHRHVDGGYVWTLCLYCRRADVAVDEDGCCTSCGVDATWMGRVPPPTDEDGPEGEEDEDE